MQTMLVTISEHKEKWHQSTNQEQKQYELPPITPQEFSELFPSSKAVSASRKLLENGESESFVGEDERHQPKHNYSSSCSSLQREED